jgi:hypothetical protein
MRRTTLVPLAIAIFTLVMLGVGLAVYWPSETKRISEVARISNQPSAIYARLLMQYDRPPIYQEEYDMQDVNGISTFRYRIRSYSGQQIVLTPPHPLQTTQVSFFFGKLVLDGVWNLMNKPARGNTHVVYTVYVKQEADFKQGDRTIVFTDPKYWATTAGRQYQIDLRKMNPNDPNALLHLTSTQLANPHYEEVVNDFLTFGSDVFRAKIARVRALIVAGKHVPSKA